MRLFFLIFCLIWQSVSSKEIPTFEYLSEILNKDGGVCGSTCTGRCFNFEITSPLAVTLKKPEKEFNTMLSNLIVDIEVLRSLVTQNGQKIGKVENDIKNKSEANQNAHQDIEGINSDRTFRERTFNGLVTEIRFKY